MTHDVRVVVAGAPPLERGACRVIAEAGANHNNSVPRAIEMAEKARQAGAWAVKYQLYKADSISVEAAPKYWCDDIGTETQFDAFKLSDHLAYDDYAAVAKACAELGIVFFATPFDLDAVEALERMDVGLYKIASGDITYQELLEAVGSTAKPVMLSTGAASEDDIERALGWLGNDPGRVVVLVCTLTYPTPDGDGNFARIPEMASRFEPYLVGMSDHTLGVAGGWMTAALGGVCIEKHYTIDKRLPDVPDHAMSVDEAELAELVEACDRAAALRGERWIGVRPSEEPAHQLARRSIVTIRPVGAGQTITPDDIGYKRPGTGIPPYAAGSVIGRAARRPLPRGTVLTDGDLE